MFYTVGIFAGADALVVVGEGHDIFAHLSGGQAPAVLPGKGVASAVIVAQRITDLVIGNALTSVCGQLVAPDDVVVGIRRTCSPALTFQKESQGVLFSCCVGTYRSVCNSYSF